MNILVVHNYYQKRGGEDAVFETDAASLENVPGIALFRYSIHNNEIAAKGILAKIRDLVRILFGNRKVAREIVELIFRHEIQIVHIHNVFPLITPAIYRTLKKKTKVKIIQTVHNYRFICPSGLLFQKGKICEKCLGGHFFSCVKDRCYKNSFLFSVLYAYLVCRYRSSFRKDIDCYIVLNDFVRKILKREGFDKKKMVLKGNALEDRNYEKESVQKEYYLYLGRVSQEKGVPFLLEVFSSLPDLRLVVAGTGPDLEQLKLRYQAPNIIFNGFVEGKEKEKLFRKAKAVIVPSVWYENYPIVIVEAFMYGIPVLGTDLGGLSSLIADHRNGLLFAFSSDPEEFCGNIREAIFRFESGEKTQWEQEARKTFSNTMEIQRSREKLIQIYKGLL